MREWERGLAVVILNYNGYDLTIESTNNFRKVSSELNIIIVDNLKVLFLMTKIHILLQMIKIRDMLQVIMSD